MNTTTSTTTSTEPTEAPSLNVAAVKRGQAIVDRAVGRSVKSLDLDIADAVKLRAEVDASGMSGRQYADAIGRDQTMVSRFCRAAEVPTDVVAEYKAAGKRVVSISGLLSFVAEATAEPKAEPKWNAQRVAQEGKAEAARVLKKAGTNKRAIAVLKAALAEFGVEAD